MCIFSLCSSATSASPFPENLQTVVVRKRGQCEHEGWPKQTRRKLWSSEAPLVWVAWKNCPWSSHSLGAAFLVLLVSLLYHLHRAQTITADELSALCLLFPLFFLPMTWSPPSLRSPTLHVMLPQPALSPDPGGSPTMPGTSSTFSSKSPNFKLTTSCLLPLLVHFLSQHCP